MVILGNKKSPKISKIFYCKNVTIIRVKNKYNNYLSTSKHEKGNKMIINDNKKSPKSHKNKIIVFFT